MNSHAPRRPSSVSPFACGLAALYFVAADLAPAFAWLSPPRIPDDRGKSPIFAGLARQTPTSSRQYLTALAKYRRHSRRRRVEEICQGVSFQILLPISLFSQLATNFIDVLCVRARWVKDRCRRTSASRGRKQTLLFPRTRIRLFTNS
jgi:hypothetical protein